MPQTIVRVSVDFLDEYENYEMLKCWQSLVTRNINVLAKICYMTHHYNLTYFGSHQLQQFVRTMYMVRNDITSNIPPIGNPGVPEYLTQMIVWEYIHLIKHLVLLVQIKCNKMKIYKKQRVPFGFPFVEGDTGYSLDRVSWRRRFRRLPLKAQQYTNFKKRSGVIIMRDRAVYLPLILIFYFSKS